jgi:alkaline phosphatase D
MNITQMSKQPVWAHIAAKKPDCLVLLGDSIYADVPAPQINGQIKTMSEMEVNEFMVHMHGLYRKQLAETNFSTLIKLVPTYAIWDDHDFLGNNSKGGVKNPAMSGHVRASRALFNAYRRALLAKDPQQFPAQTNDPALAQADEPAPGYQAVPLSALVRLHLTDGRSQKKKKQLLGLAQRKAISSDIAAHPSAIHLMASSTVFSGTWHQECWSHFQDDFDWLKGVARTAKLILISGDIHQNNHAQHGLGEGKILHEFTASGAAITFPLIKPGKHTHNFGLMHFQADRVETKFYSNQSLNPTHSLPLAYAQL